jgi:hypothetical protein
VPDAVESGASVQAPPTSAPLDKKSSAWRPLAIAVAFPSGSNTWNMIETFRGSHPLARPQCSELWHR